MALGADTEWLRYRVRCVRIGVLSTFATLAVVSAYGVLPGNEVVQPSVYWTIVAVAAAGAALISCLPWSSMFERGIGMIALYAWSVADIVLITAGLAVSGGPTSEWFPIYALTTIFFAASYPRRGQLLLLAFTWGAYTGSVVLLGATLTPAQLTARLGVLAAVMLMASFLSRQLFAQMDAHREARAESERRAALLGTVAEAARSMSTVDPDLLLRSVVDAAVRVGFDAAELCELHGGVWMQRCHGGQRVDGYDVVAPAASGLAGVVRAERRTVSLDDYTSWEHGVPAVRAAGFGAMVGCPIWCDGDLVAVLMAGRVGAGAVPDAERECLELLAGQAGAALLVARRFADRRSYEHRLEHEATHDPLTGLANRSGMAQWLAAADAVAGGHPVTMLFVDLDRFKVVNDSLGHRMGDLLLAAVAERLRRCGAGLEGLLGRHGGDEFCLLTRTGMDGALALAAQVRALLGTPLLVEGREILVSASVGIAQATDGVAAEDLFRLADLAMFEAKRQGGDRAERYSPALGRSATERMEREQALRRAIEGGELELFYQPVVSLCDGHVGSVEALVRWRHPQLGLVPPAEFVPLAESTGLIEPLGRWVLREACRQVRQWEALGVDLAVAVNVSARQLLDRHFPEMVTGVLTETGVSPCQVVLEITESVMVEEGGVEAVLDRLAAIGVGLAIDDFGQGYSSLGYLKRLPVQAVKIDRGFVTGLASDLSDRAIVQAVVTIAAELGMTVTAEGVEDSEQLAAVRQLGCDRAQGYLFSRPEPPPEALATVRRLNGTTAVRRALTSR